jgi:hypothetical protein
MHRIRSTHSWQDGRRAGGAAGPHAAARGAGLFAALVAALFTTLAACAGGGRPLGGALLVAAAAAGSRPAAAHAPLRWTPGHRDTLALWIDSAFVSTPGWRPALVGVVDDAARVWRDAGGPIRFVRAADAANADVRVHWRRWQEGPARGATTWATNARGELVGADVTIVLAPGPRQPPSPACVVRAIALHELGHALGLPHDPSPDAVMFWQTGRLDLTDRDRAAIRAASHAAAAAREAGTGG